MTVDYSTLAVGQEISTKSLVVDADAVAKYVDAVGDRSGIFDPDDERPVAPAMALAGMSLGGLVDDLGIPRDLVHVGQELEFRRAARVGEELTSTAVLVQNSVREGSRFIGVRLSVRDGDGLAVMDGKSTMIMPA